MQQSQQQKEFKQKRQAYLAQRNAQKKQARRIIKKQFGNSSSHSSSSDDCKKQPLIIKVNKEADDFNTNSSKSSKEKDRKLKDKKQIRKNQRLKHKNEAIINKRNQFGDSSSDDQPICKLPNIRIVQISSSTYKDLEEGPTLSQTEKLAIKETKINHPSKVKLKSENGDKKQAREKYDIQIPSKKGVNLWIEKELQLKENCFEFGEKTVAIYDVCKIKLLMDETLSGKKKMKICLKDEQIFLAANTNKFADNQYIDHYYFIFAKIITLKLNLMGRRYPISSKAVSVEEKYLKDVRMAGKIRKSSFFGGWEQMTCVINNMGFSMYKSGKQKASLFMGNGTIRQLWTRLQFDGQNLIVKCLHGSSKIQLSIPHQNFLSRDNWLYQLYNLTSHK